MPNSTQLETFTAGVETAVDVAQIERQLHELWQLAAESEKDPLQRQITRACLFNFVVLSETDAEAAHASEVISTLTSHHPCRAIVLSAESSTSASELSASISAHCHLAGTGQKQVCCEQIAIHASGQSVAHLGSAVLPLLESDLPTIVWWQGNFLTRIDLFRRLVAVANRVIYDTSAWLDPRSQLTGLARVLTEYPRCSFTDLSWTRLGLWRKLAAEFFDEPHCCAELPQIRAINIAHGCGPGARLACFVVRLLVRGPTPMAAARSRGPYPSVRARRPRCDLGGDRVHRHQDGRCNILHPEESWRKHRQRDRRYAPCVRLAAQARVLARGRRIPLVPRARPPRPGPGL